ATQARCMPCVAIRSSSRSSFLLPPISPVASECVSIPADQPLLFVSKLPLRKVEHVLELRAANIPIHAVSDDSSQDVHRRSEINWLQDNRTAAVRSDEAACC